MEVCDYFDKLEKVVEGDDSVEEHEERFWNLEHIFHLTGGSWLEVSNAVVADIADGAACKRR